MSHRVAVRSASVAAVLLFVCNIASAREPGFVRDPAAADNLREAAASRRPVALEGLPLGRLGLDTLDLEPMQVWARDARIIVQHEDRTETLAPPKHRYFKGSVRGEADSSAFVAILEDGRVEGIVMMAGKRFFVGTGIERTARGVKKAPIATAPIVVAEYDTLDEPQDVEDFMCGVDKLPVVAEPAKVASDAARQPVANAGVVASSYQFKVQIETDYELYLGFGSNESAVTTYIGNLVGAASVIYQRDLGATLNLGNVYVYTSAADPWDVLPTADPNTAYGVNSAFQEVGDKYATTLTARNNQASAVVLMSGKPYSAGVAWTNRLCDNSFLNGAHYAGPFAFCGSLRNGSGNAVITTTLPNAEATVNGVLYGVPSNNNFWMLLQFAHELGHVANGPHAQCVPLSDADRATYGVTRSHVDNCFALDGGACSNSGSAGATNCNGGYCDPPAELGTLMGYCHNVFYPNRITGPYRASRFIFGKDGEASEKMFNYFLAAPGAPGFPSGGGMVQATPDATITTAATPIACSAQNASVPSCVDCTYEWGIEGGTINSGAATNSVNFTPSEEAVTLTVTIVNPKGCGLTVSRNVESSCGAVVPFDPPANVVATALTSTSVEITWSAVPGATHYRVFRAQQHGSFGTEVGTPTTLLAMTDSTAAANTAYQYVVIAGDGAANWSTFSEDDLAVTVIYTDPVLTAQSTKAKLVHFTELLTAVNAINTLIGSSTVGFTAPAPGNSVTLRAQHVADLRTQLDNARGVLGYPQIFYAETSITPGITTIKAAQINELRNGMK